MNSAENRVYKATEYAIDTLRDMKVNRPLWEDNNFTGKEIYKMIVDIHETYLKLLKGE